MVFKIMLQTTKQHNKNDNPRKIEAFAYIPRVITQNIKLKLTSK